jgi:hypothetical protein
MLTSDFCEVFKIHVKPNIGWITRLSYSWYQILDIINETFIFYGLQNLHFLQNLASCTTCFFKNTVLAKFYETSVPRCGKQN